MQNSVYFCLYSELASVAAYIGLFQKKSKQGEDGGGGGEVGGGGLRGWGHTFFYKTPGYLDLLLYPKKFQTKWSFTPGISKNCVPPLWNSKAYI